MLIKKILKLGIITFIATQLLSFLLIAGVGSYIFFPSLKESDITLFEAIKGDYTAEEYIELGIIMEKRAKSSGSATAKYLTDKIGSVKVKETTPAAVEGYDTDYVMQEQKKISDKAINEALADMEETYLNK